MFTFLYNGIFKKAVALRWLGSKILKLRLLLRVSDTDDVKQKEYK